MNISKCSLLEVLYLRMVDVAENFLYVALDTQAMMRWISFCVLCERKTSDLVRFSL